MDGKMQSVTFVNNWGGDWKFSKFGMQSASTP